MYRNVSEGLVFLIISDVKHLFMCFRAILIYCFLSDFKKIQDQQKRQINVQRQEKEEWIIDAVLTDNKDNADSGNTSISRRKLFRLKGGKAVSHIGRKSRSIRQNGK